MSQLYFSIFWNFFLQMDVPAPYANPDTSHHGRFGAIWHSGIQMDST